eukprot:TRINITY_DN26646_c0_g1_i1.p1 TRINITY_DN26646_c0_g1~~TRINITY_DN26646_c0_g1_i1.p1  ORF type:complete len:486 (+),score=77.99 TRINITY_DN26646_c0_g1_i1:139-1458(+)
MFTQKTDHFNPQDTRTFQQRFWSNDEYFGTNSDIAIIYINGEGPVMSPPHMENDEVVILAKHFSGFICTLEHRYYGLSLPFKDLTTPNLQYLSSKQALNDLANFQTSMDQMLAKKHNKMPKPGNLLAYKWIVIGGSYSGALTAWYRLKFPQLTIGGVASSGVVNAILKFTEFDEQVSESVGPACAAVLRKTNRETEAALLKDPVGLKAKFNASSCVVNGDFYYLCADTMAESVQYGYQQHLCKTFMTANKTGANLVDTFAKYMNEFFYPIFGHADTYATANQQITNVTMMMNYRQWWYQKCSELAYFQIAPPKDNIRCHLLDLEYHRKHCAAVFGMNLWPNTNWTNTYYGGATPRATKVVFMNGSQDPWRRASVPKDFHYGSEDSYIVTCQNCGHCVDLGGCPGGCLNPQSLIKARDFVIAAVANFVAEADVEADLKEQ